ncbi:MAG: OstA-like protein [Prevotella sp.]
MTKRRDLKIIFDGHRISFIVTLCLFGLCIVQALPKTQKKAVNKQADRVELIHADELSHDMFGPNPNAQIVKGHVAFRHQGARLTCDSAYFYQDDNSMKAFGHVRFIQGDTLSLLAERAFYDGQGQVMRARNHVVLKHRRQTLLTDSLDYDRLYKNAYFFEGGTLIDGKDKLVSDWGEYSTETRQATFYYNVKLKSATRLVTTDTLHYDTQKSMAHVLGPSKITDKNSVVHTKNAYFDTKSDKAQLFGRSTIIDGQKTITGDSLYYNSKTGASKGYGNVEFVDKKNKNSLNAGFLQYNEKTGFGFATKKAVVIDYSQKDTLYMHADTLKLFTYFINTDSTYRKIHAYDKVRVYRKDIQAVCDSMVVNTKDSSMTMYRDPIVWNNNRQLLGESIKVFMNDSTVREAHVLGQALSIEQVDNKEHYNQISSKEMHAYFVNGQIKNAIAVSNVKSIYYPTDSKDSSLVMLNYLETDTMKMYFSDKRTLQKIRTPKAVGTAYPMTQIPSDKKQLSDFAWFEDIRPLNKDDIFIWRGKGTAKQLKYIGRQESPLQRLNGSRKVGK